MAPRLVLKWCNVPSASVACGRAHISCPKLHVNVASTSSSTSTRRSIELPHSAWSLQLQKQLTQPSRHMSSKSAGWSRGGEPSALLCNNFGSRAAGQRRCLAATTTEVSHPNALAPDQREHQNRRGESADEIAISHGSSASRSSQSFRRMSLRDLNALVEEFESCSTALELVEYIGSDVSLDTFVSELYDLIDACTGRRDTRSAARIAERILGHWLHLATGSSNREDATSGVPEMPPPGREAFTKTMNAWADTKYGYGAKRAQQIMDLQVSSSGAFAAYKSNFEPDIGTYTALIKAWAKSGEHRALHILMNTLKEMEAKAGITTALLDGKLGVESSRLNAALIPDRVCYNLVCSAWSKSSHPHSPDEIRALISRMESLAKALHMNEFRPDTRTWNMLIHSYARLGKEPTAKEAKKHRGRGRSSPSTRSQKVEELALAAESVLKDMYDRHLEQVKSGKDNNAEYTIRPNVTSFNGVLNAWSNLRGTDRAALRAEEILKLLLSTDGSVGDTATGDLPYVPGIQPDLVMYNTIIKCWARSASPEAGERAEAILWHMNCFIGRNYLFHPITKASRWSSDVVLPNVVTYNTVMDAWSKCGVAGSAERAEKLLKMMIDNPPGADGPIEPNATSFSTVIYAWSRSSDESGGERAEALLKEMNDLYRSSGDDCLKPSFACYAGVLFAYAGRGNLDEAESILQRMKLEWGVSPPRNVYNALLEGYSRVDLIADVEPGGTESLPVHQARTILEDMMIVGQEREVSRPDAASFNHFVAVCTNCENGDQPTRVCSLRVALSVFFELRQYPHFEVDSSTYLDMFQLVAKLVSKGKQERIDAYRRLFEACCRDGLLTKHLLHLLTHAVPAADLRKMLGLKGGEPGNLASLTLADLPGKWSNFRGAQALRDRRFEEKRKRRKETERIEKE